MEAVYGKDNPNKNQPQDPQGWTDFKGRLNQLGYSWTQFASGEGVMIWPSQGPATRWGEHMSHVGIYAHTEKIKQKQLLIVTSGQVTLRLSGMFSAAKKEYSHRTLIGGPREKEPEHRHLRRSMTDEIMIQICQAYVADVAGNTAQERALYTRMAGPAGAADRAAFVGEWAALLDMVKREMDEVLFNDWSLSHKTVPAKA